MISHITFTEHVSVCELTTCLDLALSGSCFLGSQKRSWRVAILWRVFRIGEYFIVAFPVVLCWTIRLLFALLGNRIFNLSLILSRRMVRSSVFVYESREFWVERGIRVKRMTYLLVNVSELFYRVLKAWSLPLAA